MTTIDKLAIKTNEKKLLVVEDEISVAKQIRWGLGSEYDITIASDAVEAKPLLASGVFPIATLDLGLPPYPDTPKVGFELLQALASIAPNTRVIVITGNAEEENAIRAISLGAVDFCAKPIDLKLLKIIIARTYGISELEAAKILEISRPTLHDLIKKHGILINK